MKYYERRYTHGSVEYVTKVYENGMHLVESWVAGTKTSITKCNIYEMGWNSLEEFLKKRKGFRKIDDDNNNSRNEKITEM